GSTTTSPTRRRAEETTRMSVLPPPASRRGWKARAWTTTKVTPSTTQSSHQGRLASGFTTDLPDGARGRDGGLAGRRYRLPQAPRRLVAVARQVAHAAQLDERYPEGRRRARGARPLHGLDRRSEAPGQVGGVVAVGGDGVGRREGQRRQARRGPGRLERGAR